MWKLASELHGAFLDNITIKVCLVYRIGVFSLLHLNSHILKQITRLKSLH